MLEFIVFAQGVAIILLGWWIFRIYTGQLANVATHSLQVADALKRACEIYDDNFLKLNNEPATVVLSGEALQKLIDDREITEPVALPVNSKGNKDVN